MKKLNKKFVFTSRGGQLGMLALSVLALGGAGYSASAYQGDYNQKGPNYSEERHESMTQAFEKNDYSAWKNLMEGRGRVNDVVNADNFAQFAEAHRLGLAGDVEGANTIRAELGLRGGNGERMGAGYGKGMGEGRGMNR